MNRERIEALLAAVAAGKISPSEAAERLATLPFVDLGFAKLDLHRELRGGQPEAVYAAGKSIDELIAIVGRLLEAHGRVLVTRLAAEPANQLRAAFSDSTYHERARVLTCGAEVVAQRAEIAVLAAGTSDLPVAEEAAVCATWFGYPVIRHHDVGVAGLHRLLDRLEELRRARVLIAVAGMDGVLPTLVAGLVARPVIAVPTSVGYGAHFGGLAPLLTMLNACAPGVAVVNIDNGYGAAVLASRIAG